LVEGVGVLLDLGVFVPGHGDSSRLATRRGGFGSGPKKGAGTAGPPEDSVSVPASNFPPRLLQQLPHRLFIFGIGYGLQICLEVVHGAARPARVQEGSTEVALLQRIAGQEL